MERSRRRRGEDEDWGLHFQDAVSGDAGRLWEGGNPVPQFGVQEATERLGLGGGTLRQFVTLAGVALTSWFLRGQMISLLFQGMQNAASILLDTDLRNVTHAAPLAGASG